VNRLAWLLVLALGGVLAWQWRQPVSSPAIPKLAPASAEEQGDALARLLEGPRIAQADYEAYGDIEARPLFFKERKPPKAYVPEPPKQRPKPKARTRKSRPPRIQLSAVIGIGDKTFALIKGGKERVTRRVRVGDEVDGWKVKALGADKLVLVNGSEEHEVLLRKYPPVLPPKQPPKPTGRAGAQRQPPAARKPPATGRKMPPRRGTPARTRAKSP